MSSFDLIGGVGILGFLSPMDTEDNYAVIDPIYGIDGLRNVESLNDLNQISFERRRSGMIVGVNGGEKYYRLKQSPWLFDISDWVELNFVKEIYVDKENPIGNIDGVNKEFYLSKIPILNSEHIFLNGLLQEQGDDYEIDNSKIIFYESPINGMKIRCTYRTL